MTDTTAQAPSLKLPDTLPEDYVPTPEGGLSDAEAQRRLAAGLGNDTTADPGKSVLRILADNLFTLFKNLSAVITYFVTCVSLLCTCSVFFTYNTCCSMIIRIKFAVFLSTPFAKRLTYTCSCSARMTKSFFPLHFCIRLNLTTQCTSNSIYSVFCTGRFFEYLHSRSIYMFTFALIYCTTHITNIKNKRFVTF